MGKQGIDVAGQYMVGQDADGNPHVVAVDENGVLLGTGGGGGTQVVEGSKSPEADLYYSADFIRAISALFAWNGTNYRRLVMTEDSLNVNVTNQTIVMAVPITPGDTEIPATKGLYIGGLGDVVVTMGVTDITLTNLAIGVWHPIRVTKIKATGTTATNILAGY